MTDFFKMSDQERRRFRDELQQRYQDFKSRQMALDMTRGKPCPEQLDLALEMIQGNIGKIYRTEDGLDCRNYGGLDGIPPAKALFCKFVDVEPDELLIGGNSSLNLMHDTILRAMVKGTLDDTPPWGQLPKVKFLCPSPGYDRHFFICEYLGIEMIPIEMSDSGPDMDLIEDLVAEDDLIKGIWCVPKYSNPTGVIYSDETVERLANMKTRANDFRIFWDNAYAVHHLADKPAPLKNMLTACKQAGNPDRVFVFASTSKISFAGAGLAIMAGSRANMEWVKNQMSFQTIGPDKLNQLRHVLFFKDMAGIQTHMQKHAVILKPKFEAVQNALASELEGKNIARWSRPQGGYFVSIDTLEGCAAAVIKKAADAGVKLTPAGSTYPYKKDPQDRNIRIAPTFPPLEDIQAAMGLVTICIQLASLEKLST
ncbi:MAG: aminotransferase class I/II-fold pyridoxal phosphate-dependent enzyme [Deltaproteobacteria bacterium]|jgi:aspartate/methionine/tyrosine aminotransferase|nr:aminotransferase class I/II-fold pyridoxal phosphate-dependent enzyme [Deltaproteobacteria bacterium]